MRFNIKSFFNNNFNWFLGKLMITDFSSKWPILIQIFIQLKQSNGDLIIQPLIKTSFFAASEILERAEFILNSGKWNSYKNGNDMHLLLYLE